MASKLKTAKRLRWLLLAMSFSLIGISGIQAYWINNAFEIKQKEFDKDVANAMSQVGSRLETIESMKFLFDSFNFEPVFSSSIDSYSNSKKLKNDSSKSSDHPKKTLSLRVSSDTMFMIEEGLADYRFNTKFTEDSLKKFLESDPEVYKKEAEKLDYVLQELIKQRMNRDRSIENRVSKEVLDSLIGFELFRKGIQLQYQFAVADKDSIVMQTELWTEESEQFRAVLFPNEMGARSLLMITFPSKARFIIGNMWWTLLMSILFTLAMIFTFYKTISYSLKQKRINEIKTDFINNMTHEFKTPIATINLAIDALTNEKVLGDVDRIKKYSGLIKQENKRMNRQVESVLRMAMLDRKELEYNFQNIDFTALVQECISHIQLSLEDKKGVLNKNIGLKSIHVYGDKNHLSNAIINVLDNAIKYSLAAPEIELNMETQEGYLKLSISDKGIGMSKAELTHIFDRFYRASSGDIHNSRGHGLGLSYTKGIIEDHKGRIEVESEKTKGSRFSLYLPINEGL